MVSTAKRIPRYVEPQTIYKANNAIQIFVFIHFLLLLPSVGRERRGFFALSLQQSVSSATVASLLDQRCVRKLSCQQRLLPQLAIAIIPELTDLADHTMAWDQHRDRVVSDCCANCPHRARLADM